ncbi:MAG: ferritin [Chloroflexota bacterium]|nr:ferritin [Chloroflexota bacterium]
MSKQDAGRGLGPLSEDMLDGLNQQISNEFAAEFAYLAMAGWFDNESLLGCSAFMEAQAAEERGHALRLYEYVLDRNGRIVIGPVAAVYGDFSGAVDAFRTALSNEEGVSESIKRLHQMALDEGDSPTAVFLEWFLTEQVEEEKTFDDIVRRFELAGDNAAALLVLDIELGGKAGGDD